MEVVRQCCYGIDGQIFRENSVPPRDPVSHVDRKLRARIREKKIALGQNPNDHEVMR